ncbi:hypothetical protein WM94_16720 [Pseudomonas sp. ABFPK]|nr:hypothetical protein WM94_16720 [Pseudomonas sp. ABFPK]
MIGLSIITTTQRQIYRFGLFAGVITLAISRFERSIGEDKARASGLCRLALQLEAVHYFK